MPQKRPRILFVLLLLAALIFLIWPAVAGFYTDWLWYQELGYQTVFTTKLVTELMLGFSVGVLTAAVIWFNIKIALRMSAALPPVKRFIRVDGEAVAAPDLSRIAARM